MASLKEKRLFLLDMDGTIYLDEDLFPGTLPFLNHVKEQGGKYLFLTNNSSRSVETYIQKLNRLGIAAESDDFLTSTNALIEELRHREPYHLCYAFGTAAFRQQLSDAGVPVTDKLSDDIDCLLIGFDTELTFQKLEDACILLGRGVDFIATNPDWVCPTWYGSVPDCGSVCQMLHTATGRRPQVIGKPQPAMALLAMEKWGYSKEETVMIGDRLYTDIASGVNAGIDTVFVLSGEGTLADLESGETKPTWVLNDISAVLDELKK